MSEDANGKLAVLECQKKPQITSEIVLPMKSHTPTLRKSSPNMKTRFALFAAALACGLLGNAALAQTVATDPVGFVQPFNTTGNQINCLANSDTHISIPFIRPPEFIGATSSATTNTLTVNGSPWTAGQFVYAAGTQPKTYFVLIGPHASTNPKEGRMYQVTGNSTNQLTVNAGADDLSSVAASTQILVIPYHTVSSVFPDSDANVSFKPSASPITHETEVLIPNYSGSGTNLSPSITYFYYNGAWRQFGRPLSESHNDDAFPNAGYFVVRNGATGTTLTTLGSVLTKKTTTPLFTRTSGAQDNFVSLIRPVDVKLNDLGLISSGAFLPSTSPITHTDELLLFNPAVAARNKAPSTTYFYYNGAWRKFGQSLTTDFGNDVVPSGAGVIIRKGATAGGATSSWTNSPTY